MSKSPETELEEFLAALPAWLQKVLHYDHSSLTRYEQLEWIKNRDEELRLRPEYERILDRCDRVQWNEYCERARQFHEVGDKEWERWLPLPKGKAGRRPDRKAAEYLAQHSSKSYRQMAKEELQAEPEGEAKKLLIEKERERIRQSVSRSRRRKNT